MMRMIGNVVCFLLLAQLLAQFPASDGMKCYFGMETAGGGVPKTEVHCATTQCVTATSTCTDHDECRKRLKQVESKLHGIDAGTDLSGVKLLKKVIEKALVADGVRVRSFGCAEKCIPEVRKGLRVDYDCCRGALCNEGDEDDLIVEAVSHAHKADGLQCYDGVRAGELQTMTEKICPPSHSCVTAEYACADRDRCRARMLEVVSAKVPADDVEVIIDEAMTSNFFIYSCTANCTNRKAVADHLEYEWRCCAEDFCNFGDLTVNKGDNYRIGELNVANAGSAANGSSAPNGASSVQMSASLVYAMISSLVACVFLFQYFSM